MMEINESENLNPESYKEFLAEAGYLNVEVIVKQMVHHLASEQDWWEIICNSGLRDIIETLSAEQLENSE